MVLGDLYRLNACCKMVLVISIYTLWLFNSLPWYRWPIEIDDFPSELKLHLWFGFSMAMLNSMVYGRYNELVNGC